jgi:hypothetical protein
MHPMQIAETEVRGMPYRQLSRDEIIQLSQEVEDLVRWEGARDYVSALYGLEARDPHGLPPHQVTISLESVPLDRSTYGESVNILVTDSNNRLLPFDLSRFWWSQFALGEDTIAALLADTTGKLANIRTLNDGAIYRALQDLCTELLGIEFGQRLRPHDPITFMYTIDTPPSVSHRAVYVDDELDA